MISAECPETYVSSSRRSRATLHADVAVDDAASAPGLEHPRRFVDESQSPLTMRQTPTDPLDRVDKCNACRAIGGGGVRPAFGRLSHVVDPHGQMKPIQTWRVGPKLAASPRERGPAAPSLKIVTGVLGVAPGPMSARGFPTFAPAQVTISRWP
jgi:hypothetical protein